MNLTDKEKAVAACVLDALTDKEVARAIGLCQHSVERYIQNIKAKVGGARNRVELALKLQTLANEDHARHAAPVLHPVRRLPALDARCSEPWLPPSTH